MRFPRRIAIAIILVVMMAPAWVAAEEDCRRCVILLHGLARTESSMKKLERALDARGYCAVNTGYPSTELPVETIVRDHLPRMVEQCRARGAARIDFVTHSLGGILVRAYLQENALPDGSRIVMIGPPNHGSPIVDRLKNVFLFRWVNGPAGQVLGTGADSLPNTLPPVDAEIGIIAGNCSFNPLFSALIPGDDDGKVAVESAKLDEMADFLVVPRTHTFMMNDDDVIRQTILFLEEGKFDHGPNAGRAGKSGD